MAMVESGFAIWLNTVFAGFDLGITSAIYNLLYPLHGFFTPFMEFISFLGHDGIPLILLSLVLMFFKKTRRYGTAMLFGLAIGAIFTNCVLKVLIARARPYADASSPFYQMWLTVGQNMESDKSFPSGHTTAAFDSMVALFLTMDRKKRIRWTTFIFAFLMGISRIYLCVHFPTDVIAGMVVGIVAGILGALANSKLPRVWLEMDFLAMIKGSRKKGKHECSD